MPQTPNRIVAWVATQVMPHEGRVRAWLRRSSLSGDEIDDLVQEAYCKLSALESVDHIRHPEAYFRLIVRNLVTDGLRRARIVRFETVQEMEAMPLPADEPSPEDITAGRRELARVGALIANLPADIRRVVELRKIQGLSQKEIAARMGIKEARVEHLAVRGMKLLLEAMRQEDPDHSTLSRRTSDDRSRNRRAD